MKTQLITTLLLLFTCCFSYGKSTNSNNDSISIKCHEISNIVSMDLFETIKTFILKNGDRETYCNMYGNNPHYSFSEFDVYLNPEIGQSNIDCDTSKSDFNVLVIRDMKANPQYYDIQIVRKGDLANTLIHTWEGMGEEKVYLVDFDNQNKDSLISYVGNYIEKIKKELSVKSVSIAKSSTEKFTVYPNSVQDKLFVRIDNSNSLVFELDIMDSRGLILHEGCFNVKGQINQAIDVSKLHHGFYLCRIKAGEKMMLFKFVKR